MGLLLTVNTFSVLDAIKTSLLGFAIVFFVLLMLLLLILLLRGFMEKLERVQKMRNNTMVVKETATAQAALKLPFGEGMIPAKGSIGDIKLHDVEDKTAAILMAIVAKECSAPLNELHFHSIREKRTDASELHANATGAEFSNKYYSQNRKESSADMKYNITLNNKVYEVEVEHGEATLIKVSDYEPLPKTAVISESAVTTVTSIDSAVSESVNGETVNAPLPGMVLSIQVEVGDTVKMGQGLMILEAMKMENEIVAPRDCKISQILVSKGASVDTNSPLIMIE